MPDPISKADKAWKAYQKRMADWKKKNPGEDPADAFDFKNKKEFMADYNSKGKKKLQDIQYKDGWNNSQAAQFLNKHKGKTLDFKPTTGAKPFKGKFVRVEPSRVRDFGYEVVIKTDSGKELKVSKKGLKDLYNIN